MTVFQKCTFVLLALYGIWEIYVQIWSRSEETAVIRVDLFIIYPILFVFILISFVQYLKSKK